MRLTTSSALGWTWRLGTKVPQLVSVLPFFVSSLASLSLSVQHGEAFVPDVDLGKGGKEGAKETPFLWVVTLDDVVGPTVVSWDDESYGFDFEDGMRRISHAAWADDSLVFSSSMGQMSCMVQELTGALGAGKLSWKPGGLSVMANDAALRTLDRAFSPGLLCH